ncbi:hypothetical protein [Arthrobacter sp. zg-Y769]|uniref:hypothetical protein n=1 Tax=Arthrobacter sp. zg-Y769 TaxID=2894191 RepID=UPI001E359B3B|nr:hypothetical protein [Arthrobacter sp. zg-Y769]MCC9204407.1 hypothetical protein [Arthrobacter sp. zg-Y769]
MVPALVSWVLAVWVVVTCLTVAVSVWKRAGLPSGPSRRSVVAGLLEAAWFAGLMRLVVSWSPGSVVLWVVAVVVLAAAVAGAIVRWPELPDRVRGSGAVQAASEGEARQEALPAEAEGEAVPVGQVPKPDVTVLEVPEQSRRPFLPAQEAPYGSATGKPRRKTKAAKKPKKDPGNLALVVNAALLLAVVVVSFLAG